MLCEQLPLQLHLSPMLEQSNEMSLSAGLADGDVTLSAVVELLQSQGSNTASKMVRKNFSFCRRFIWRKREVCSWPCSSSARLTTPRFSILPGILTVCSFFSSKVGCGFYKILVIFFSTLYSVCLGVNNVNLCDQLPQIPTLLCYELKAPDF